MDDVEDKESGICATEEWKCQHGSATEELQAQARIWNAGEEGIANDEDRPTFSTAFSFPLLDAHAFTYKEGERVVHESRSWADVVKGNRCSP